MPNHNEKAVLAVLAMIKHQIQEYSMTLEATNYDDQNMLAIWHFWLMVFEQHITEINIRLRTLEAYAISIGTDTKSLAITLTQGEK